MVVLLVVIVLVGGSTSGNKRFKVEHEILSNLGKTALDQADQVQCDNGAKSIHIKLNIFDLKMKNFTIQK